VQVAMPAAELPVESEEQLAVLRLAAGSAQFEWLGVPWRAAGVTAGSGAGPPG